MNFENLTTWDFWGLEEELCNCLEAKGYGLVQCDLNHDKQGILRPCFKLDTPLALKLADTLAKCGFKVELKKHERRSQSYVFIENTYPVELLPIVDEFEVAS